MFQRHQRTSANQTSVHSELRDAQRATIRASTSNVFASANFDTFPRLAGETANTYVLRRLLNIPRKARGILYSAQTNIAACSVVENLSGPFSHRSISAFRLIPRWPNCREVTPYASVLPAEAVMHQLFLLVLALACFLTPAPAARNTVAAYFRTSAAGHPCRPRAALLALCFITRAIDRRLRKRDDGRGFSCIMGNPMEGAIRCDSNRVFLFVLCWPVAPSRRCAFCR